MTNSNYKNAIVNDELTLKLNFTNNKDFTITIIPELKLSVENSIQFKKYEQIIINPNKSNVTNIQFLLTEEGTNHVNLTANVFYTNGTIIDKIDAPITLQVVSSAMGDHGCQLDRQLMLESELQPCFASCLFFQASV